MIIADRSMKRTQLYPGALIVFFASLSVVNTLLSIEYPLSRDCEIAGMTNKEAQSLIHSACTQIEENLHEAEALCSHTEQNVDGKQLMAVYLKMLTPIMQLMGKSFGHYAWRLQQDRFKSLSTEIHARVSADHNFYSALGYSIPAQAEHSDINPKKKILLMFTFPQALPSFHPFMPTKPELFCARLISTVGHEFGHVLNEYGRPPKPFTVQSICGVMLPTIGLTLAPATLLKFAPLWCNRLGMKRLLGGTALCYTAALITSWLGRVALLRKYSHRKEYDADAAALLLAPQCMRYGDICYFTEARCEDYYQDQDNIWLTLQRFVKTVCIPGYDTHPSNMARMAHVCIGIVESTPPDKQKAAIEQLEHVAQASLDNYKHVYRNTPAAIDAVRKTRADVFRVFAATRAQFHLTKKFSCPMVET